MGSLNVSGIDDLAQALRAMAARVNAATPMAVMAATATVEAQARTELSRLSHPPGTPTPSPPGSPPAMITGRLRDSFDILGPTQAGSSTWRAVLGPTAVYARVQERGGAAGRGGASILPARPYLRPAAETAIRSGAVQREFTTAWGRAITG